MVRDEIEKRIARSDKFLNEKIPGKALVMRSGAGDPNYEMHWVRIFHHEPVENFLDAKRVSAVNDDFLKIFHAAAPTLLEVDDDAVPTIEVYFSIGSIVSMMSGKRALFLSDTGWCDPIFESIYDFDQLHFDPDNPWVRFHILAAQDLINKWEGDFTLIPAFHRSPLDAANGLRGDSIFYDICDDLAAVREAVMACTRWSLALEKHLKEALTWPEGLRRGTWGMALPGDAVFVNGDPVDLVSAAHQQYLDRPSAEELFTKTGGGFFHHHALGLRQVTNVAKTRGMLVQNVITDPGIEPPIITMLHDEKMCQRVIDASLLAPIHINADFLPIADQILPILKQGRFIIRQDVWENAPKLLEKLEPVRV